MPTTLVAFNACSTEPSADGTPLRTISDSSSDEDVVGLESVSGMAQLQARLLRCQRGEKTPPSNEPVPKSDTPSDAHVPSQSTSANAFQFIATQDELERESDRRSTSSQSSSNTTSRPQSNSPTRSRHRDAQMDQVYGYASMCAQCHHRRASRLNAECGIRIQILTCVYVSECG